MPSEKTPAAWHGLRHLWRAVVRPSATCQAALLGFAGVLVVAAVEADGRQLPPGTYSLPFSSAPASVRVSDDGREVLVVFDRALPDGEADRVSRALGPLVEGWSEGYGAVRFRLAEPVRAELTGESSRRRVEIVTLEDTAATREDEDRLAILQARVQAMDGDVDGARVRLRGLAADRPGDMEPLLAMADVETGAARWQHALGLYDGVLRLFPEATDIVRDRNALATQHAPAVRLDTGATFGPNGERAQTVTLAGEAPVGEAWRIGASLQTTHDEIRGLRRSGSDLSADYTGTKVLAGLSLAHDWNSPTLTTKVGLFAAPATVGASLKQDVTTRLGQTSIGATYHQPYWGTVMAFAADARRDQVGVAQTVPLPDQWQVQLGAGLIRYGLPSHDDVASGPTALAGVSRGLPERWMPWPGMQVRAGYRLEAEYLSGVQTGPTPGGYLSLLDVRRREVHSLYAEGTIPVWTGTATALLGYALDRYGGGGPQTLLRFTSGEDTARLAFSAEVGTEPSLDINPRTLFHVGGFLIWRFGG